MSQITAKEIRDVIRRLGGFYSVYVPEFTYGQLRCDVALIDVDKRWIRGFEIKVNRADFLKDEKWQRYSEFCSSLSVACPDGVIKPEEIPSPFGLLYVVPDEFSTRYAKTPQFTVKWAKKPKRFQRRDGMAWLYQYVKCIEKELPRLTGEVDRLRERLAKRSGLALTEV